MDITIYLPEDLGKRAKEEPGLNLSRMLRDALVEHFEREDAMTRELRDAREIVLDLEDKDGRPFRGRVSAVLLASWKNAEVYLTDDRSVLVYDGDKLGYDVVEDPESELQWLPEDVYLDAMASLGITPTIDLVLR